MTDFYKTLDEIIVATLTLHAINPDIISDISKQVTSAVAAQFGGRILYLHNGKKAKTSELHQQILSEFNGFNHDVVCKKYDISRAWLNKLVNRNKSAKP